MTDPSSKAPAERHSAASAEPALLAELVEQSPDVIVVHDGERILYVNRTGMRLLAAGDGDSLVGRTIQDFLPDSFVAAARARTEEMLHTGQPAPVVEIPLLLGDGTERWGEVRSAPLVGGEHGRVQTVIRDVTERKRMAAALAESEERYRTLFEGVPVGLYRTARDGRFLSVNHALARMLGYSDPESLVGTRAADLYSDRDERESWVADAMEHDVVTGREVRLVGTDGREVRGRLNTRVRRDPEGRVEAFEGSVEDVTETSRAEERYRLLFETMAQGVVYHDARGRIVSTNPAAERILGMGADDLQARTLPEAGLRALRPDGTSLPAADLPPAEALRTGQRVRELVGIELGDGRRQRWLELECLPLIPPGTERPRGVCSIFVDVTDRLGTEQDLRRSEQRLERALSGSGLGLWDWDMENDEIYLDARWYAMLGYEPGAFRLTGEGWLELVHPEDRERAKEALHRHLDGLEPSYECETRLRTADGGWHWVLDRGRVVERSPDGRPLRAAGTHTDIQERKEAEVALLRSEDRLASIFRAAPLGITLSRVDDGTLLEVNDAFGEEFGYDREELIGRSSVELGLWQDAGERQAAVKELAETGRIRGLSVRFTHRNGQTREVQLFTELVTVEGEACALTLHRDVTEARQLEEQLRQSQKMEAIGRLAGGIAHDFNNLLTAISGHVEFLLDDLQEGDRRRRDAEGIRESAERAKRLTRQLLAFSRQQMLDPQVVDLGRTVETFQPLLARLIGEDVRLEVERSDPPCCVRVDLGQLEQVVLNLVVNARDAMPEGGRLRIATDCVRLNGGRPDAVPREVPPGRYARLAVCDTGSGMDADTLDRVFEPFFTTKPAGKGTGLGLSTVYGIVNQSDGYIGVESEPGVGTTFTLYLPAVDPESTKAESADEGGEFRAGGHETVLLVEDEPAVRVLARRVLERVGYVVRDAGEPDEALAMAEELPGVDLLLTDVVMPGMNGRELADRLRDRWSDLSVVFMSGYTADEVIRDSGARDGSFLQKPFTPNQLARAVREALDA